MGRKRISTVGHSIYALIYEHVGITVISEINEEKENLLLRSEVIKGGKRGKHAHEKESLLT